MPPSATSPTMRMREALTTTGGCRRCTASADMPRAATSPATPSRLHGCRRTTCTLPAARRGLSRRRSRCDDACRAMPVRCRSARSPARARASALTSATSRPGFDTNDLGFMRRADEKNQSNWFQWRNFKPGKYVRTRNFNINQYQAGISAATACIRAATSTRTGRSRTTTASAAATTSTPRRSAIA